MYGPSSIVSFKGLNRYHPPYALWMVLESAFFFFNACSNFVKVAQAEGNAPSLCNMMERVMMVRKENSQQSFDAPSNSGAL